MLPEDDVDRNFILEGIRDGFKLVETREVDIISVESKNHRSSFQNRELAEKQIKEEIELGNYGIAETKPTIVSAFGAIPKSANKIRLIHDGSLPAGKGMNSYMVNCECTYMDLREAKKLIKPGSFLAKVHPSNYDLTGLCWRFEGDQQPTYLFDKKLPFGASKSPKIFQTLSAAVCCIMKVRFGIQVIAYIDDFLIVADTAEVCARALERLIYVLRALGFNINWNKVDGPLQRIVHYCYLKKK